MSVFTFYYVYLLIGMWSTPVSCNRHGLWGDVSLSCSEILLGRESIDNNMHQREGLPKWPRATVTLSAAERRIYLNCKASYPVEFFPESGSLNEKYANQIANNLNIMYHPEAKVYSIRTYIEFTSGESFTVVTTCKPTCVGFLYSERITFGRSNDYGFIADCVTIPSHTALTTDAVTDVTSVTIVEPAPGTTTQQPQQENAKIPAPKKVAIVVVAICMLGLSFIYGFVMGWGCSLVNEDEGHPYKQIPEDSTIAIDGESSKGEDMVTLV